MAFEYHFSGEMAQKYGLDEAIIIHHIAYWVKKNTIDGRNIHDGRAWTYNSQHAFSEWFGWWSRRQIQRILTSLEDKGAVLKGNYNTKPMDRTLWYTVSDDVLIHYDIPRPPQGLNTMEPETDTQTVLCTDPNGAMESTEACCGEHGTVPAIPKNKHKEKPKKTLSEGACVDQEAQFKAFWEKYPRPEGKKKAREKWMRLKPDPELFAKIMAGLEQHTRSDQWRRGVIPHATTWLNGERWEDELPGSNRPAPEPPQRIDPGEGFRYV